jgi:hypothetical protein
MTAVRDVTWARSTFCGPSGGCVEVALVDGVVLVRDSKLGDDSPVQEWTPGEWCDLLAPIKSDSDYPWGFSVMVSGEILLGLIGHEDLLIQHEGLLRFDRDEWSAFSNGVKAGEFDLVRLLPGFKTSSGVGERSGVGDAPAAAVTGAGGGAVLPVPVAAQDLAGAEGHHAARADSASVASVPAGRADAEEGDRPGLTDEDEPPDSPARRAARVALRRVYDNGIFQESIGMGDVLDACSDAAIDAFLETTLAEAARPLGAGS